MGCLFKMLSTHSTHEGLHMSISQTVSNYTHKRRLGGESCEFLSFLMTYHLLLTANTVLPGFPDVTYCVAENAWGGYKVKCYKFIKSLFLCQHLSVFRCTAQFRVIFSPIILCYVIFTLFYFNWPSPIIILKDIPPLSVGSKFSLVGKPQSYKILVTLFAP